MHILPHEYYRIMPVQLLLSNLLIPFQFIPLSLVNQLQKSFKELHLHNIISRIDFVFQQQQNWLKQVFMNHL